MRQARRSSKRSTRSYCAMAWRYATSFSREATYLRSLLLHKSIVSHMSVSQVMNEVLFADALGLESSGGNLYHVRRLHIRHKLYIHACNPSGVPVRLGVVLPLCVGPTTLCSRLTTQAPTKQSPGGGLNCECVNQIEFLSSVVAPWRARAVFPAPT